MLRHIFAHEPRLIPYLKPCPFCGGEVNFDTNIFGEFCIECHSCNVELTTYFKTPEEFITIWNKRS